MKLILISGTTSTGKSTLARKLSRDLHIEACLRDVYKEQRFDQIPGRPNLKQLAEIDKTSKQLLFQAVADAVESGTSLIVESNFRFTDGMKIKELLRPGVTVVEIFCYANGFRVLRRYVGRYKNGERHHGHRDYLWYPIVGVEAFGLSRLRYRPLRLSTNVLLVNTNDFAAIDYDAIRRYVLQAN